jgi:hypothetical protein
LPADTAHQVKGKELRQERRYVSGTKMEIGEDFTGNVSGGVYLERSCITATGIVYHT